MLNVEYDKQPQKFLRKLRDKQLLKRILDEVEALRIDPFPRGCIKVEGYNGRMFRVRVGVYRILYYVDYESNTLFIFKIDIRGRVYD